MTPNDTETKRRSLLAKTVACSLVACGLLAAAIAPASADNDDWYGHGNGHHKHHRWKHYPQGPAYGYYYAPPPPPVYYAPPPPPPVYYQPAPVYYQPAPVVVYPRRPSVSIVFPIDIH